MAPPRRLLYRTVAEDGTTTTVWDDFRGRIFEEVIPPERPTTRRGGGGAAGAPPRRQPRHDGALATAGGRPTLEERSVPPPAPSRPAEEARRVRPTTSRREAPDGPLPTPIAPSVSPAPDDDAIPLGERGLPIERAAPVGYVPIVEATRPVPATPERDAPVDRLDAVTEPEPHPAIPVQTPLEVAYPEIPPLVYELEPSVEPVEPALLEAYLRMLGQLYVQGIRSVESRRILLAQGGALALSAHDLDEITADESVLQGFYLPFSARARAEFVDRRVAVARRLWRGHRARILERIRSGVPAERAFSEYFGRLGLRPDSLLALGVRTQESMGERGTGPAWHQELQQERELFRERLDRRTSVAQSLPQTIVAAVHVMANADDRPSVEDWDRAIRAAERISPVTGAVETVARARLARSRATQQVPAAEPASRVGVPIGSRATRRRAAERRDRRRRERAAAGAPPTPSVAAPRAPIAPEPRSDAGGPPRPPGAGAPPRPGTRRGRSRAALVTDPEAVEAQRLRYLDMSGPQLRRRAARGDGMAQSILRQTIPPNEATLRRLQESDYRPPHSATARLLRRGRAEVGRKTLHSGNTTPTERELGWRRGGLASHTEARAVRAGQTFGPRGHRLARGDTLMINGQYDPCWPCQRAMQAAATRTGATIVYWWPGGPGAGERFVPGEAMRMRTPRVSPPDLALPL